MVDLPRAIINVCISLEALKVQPDDGCDDQMIMTSATSLVIQQLSDGISWLRASHANYKQLFILYCTNLYGSQCDVLYNTVLYYQCANGFI